jgi:hypothetical protein
MDDDFGVPRVGSDRQFRGSRKPAKSVQSFAPRARSQEQRLDQFESCLRAEVAKRAGSRKMHQSIPRNMRMTMHANELKCVLQRKVMREMFELTEKQLGNSLPDRNSPTPHCVSVESFTDTLERFETAGQDALNVEDAHAYWNMFQGDYSAMITKLYPMPAKVKERGIPTNKYGFALPLPEVDDLDEIGMGPLPAAIDDGDVQDRYKYRFR